MNKNIVFIIPDERKVYECVNVKVGAFHLPSLAFAILGAIARNNGYQPHIVDLTLGRSGDPACVLDQALAERRPEYVAITCTSATYYLAIETAHHVKSVMPATKILIGGPHVSALVEETLTNECFDIVFIGEAEVSFAQLLQGIDPAIIDGIASRDESGKLRIRKNQQFLRNLDDYPIPDYSLYDLSRYQVTRLHARRNPVVWIETSRGCPFDCQICSKVVHGQTFRPKSVARVMAEIERFIELGIKELHIADDGFTSDMGRAEAICDKLIERKLDISWSCANGIRVDCVSRRLLEKMKAAGCYRISFGIESGSQQVLDNLGKRIKLEQVEAAVRLAKTTGFEVFGFFIFGFIDDTEATMQATIDFAKRLPLDLAKASIMMPFPGSPLFDKYAKMNLLYPTTDYRSYNVYVSPYRIYRHPSLNWDVVTAYRDRFYRSFYFNPRYILRRLLASVRTGSLMTDIAACLTMRWFGRDGNK